MTMTRGIKKVSEQILTDERGVIVTETDKLKYDWNDIPAGSKYIDKVTGIEQVKLKDVVIDKETGHSLGSCIIRDNKLYRQDGVPLLDTHGQQYTTLDVDFSEETDWVPAGIKQDGTLCIAKDSMIIEEIFTIQQLNDGAGNMVYTNSKGQTRRFPIRPDGSYVFELEYGRYIRYRNHLEVYVDNKERLDRMTGDIIELKENRFAFTKPLTVGQKLTARYIRIFRIGNPYPRIFLDENEPEGAEIGDLWIDLDDYINTNIGVFIKKYIYYGNKTFTDEPLDGGFQPAEIHGAQNDL